MSYALRSTLLHLILLFAVLGLVDSIYLANAAYTHTSLVCNINGLDGCNAVAQSGYSRVFGVPLATFGVLFYALIIACLIYLKKRTSPLVRNGLLLVTTIGMVSSFYFMYLQLYVINALCVYCAGSFLLSVLIWIASCVFVRKPSQHTI